MDKWKDEGLVEDDTRDEDTEEEEEEMDIRLGKANLLLYLSILYKEEVISYLCYSYRSDIMFDCWVP